MTGAVHTTLGCFYHGSHMATTAARLPDIDPARCTGCGWCIAACKPAVLGFVREGWRKRTELLEPDQCTGCTLCELRCPVHAIAMRDADEVRALLRTATPAPKG